MDSVHRVLDSNPVESLADHLGAGGGDGLDLARSMGAEEVVAEVRRTLAAVSVTITWLFFSSTETVPRSGVRIFSMWGLISELALE